MKFHGNKANTRQNLVPGWLRLYQPAKSTVNSLNAKVAIL